MQVPARCAGVAVPPLPPSPVLVPNPGTRHPPRSPPRAPIVVQYRSPPAKPRGKPADDPLPDELKWDELRSLVNEEYGIVIGGGSAPRKATAPLVIEVPKIARRDSDREGWDELSLSSTIPREASNLTEDTASNTSVTARSEGIWEEGEVDEDECDDVLFGDIEAASVCIRGLAADDHEEGGGGGGGR